MQTAPRARNSSPEISAAARSPVELPTQQIETLGVRFEPVEMHSIDSPIRAVATVVADESRITHVHARVAGWLEELYINTTGQAVRAGQPLAPVFSQELYSSQQEYLSALRRVGSGPASAVLDAARTRLDVLGMSRPEIERLEKTGEARRLVTITAPRSGIVLNRGVSAGTAVDPSTETVARDAVVDTGRSQHVFVHTSENVIEPRTVRVGARLADRVEILQGLTPGDHVVTTGVFLIDSESRLRASGGTGHSGHGGDKARAPRRDGDDATETDAPAKHEH